MSSGPGWLARLLRRGGREAPLDPDRADLVVVAECCDDVEAASTTLERASATMPAWRADQPAVLRHHLRVPAGRVEAVVDIAAQDGYIARVAAEADGVVDVDLYRVQVLDALHCSQERSRMAGLAQRHEGDVLGWDALQPES
ncbi:hypothetical protein [Aldersonia kunmingensis]|uniref:hypothetical protein n=1 Tax=Aldersonia kunmingensis TaxID=408066 RepID=UPI0008340A5C|nr:hypothetical protein [Aldersonia kunmingensis]